MPVNCLVREAIRKLVDAPRGKSGVEERFAVAFAAGFARPAAFW